MNDIQRLRRHVTGQEQKKKRAQEAFQPNKLSLAKTSAFLVLIYLLISSAFWRATVLKKIQLADEYDNITNDGYVFNGIMLAVFYIIALMLINCGFV